MKAGVYAIQNIETGRTYVGSSSCIAARWAQHRYNLRRGEHQAHDLQMDWTLYGEAGFVFVVLERIEDAEARIFCEQMHIDRLTHPYNVNGRAGSGPKVGRKHSKASLLKMRLAQLGKKKSDAHCAAISLSRQGMKLSAEHRAAIGAGLKGGKRSPETRRKMSESTARIPHVWGALISAGKKGKPWSAARRAAHNAKSLKTG